RGDAALDPARARGIGGEVGDRGVERAGDGARRGAEDGGAEEFPRGGGAPPEGVAVGGEPPGPVPGPALSREAVRGGRPRGPGAAAARGSGRRGPEVRAGGVGAVARAGDRAGAVALPQGVADAPEGRGVLRPALPSGPGGGARDGREEEITGQRRRGVWTETS